MFALGDNKGTQGVAVETAGDQVLSTTEATNITLSPSDKVTSGVLMTFNDDLDGLKAKHFLYNAPQA